ncbi:hypothetical protein [Actinomadura rupiterrae]|uniref:hypothetical protein n=1 Tax=Actinomadura rupiterrae TaxID=559627 RepID=UPI0020A45DDA|nr:hypothetical protein [Actinomadura rupiterrae]MCP2342946.1 hypothetical protein [Actinomadura rupiterrae]
MDYPIENPTRRATGTATDPVAAAYAEFISDAHRTATSRRDAADIRVHQLTVGGADGDLCGAVAGMARARAYAGWWDRVTAEIETGGYDPCDALHEIADIALTTLVTTPVPDHADGFARAFNTAHLDGTRAFYFTATEHAPTTPVPITPCPDDRTTEPAAPRHIPRHATGPNAPRHATNRTSDVMGGRHRDDIPPGRAARRAH